MSQCEHIFKCGNVVIDYTERYRYLGLCGDMHHNVFTRLYDNLVQPVLTYCSGIWGANKYPEMYTIQRKTCRAFLGVPKNTPNLAVQGDMGWLDPQYKVYIEAARLWCRLERTPDTSFLSKIHSWSKTFCKSWDNKLIKVFNGFGLEHIITSLDKSSGWILNKIVVHLKEVDFNNWYQGVQALPKLRTYKLFKTVLSTELYLNLPRYKRSILASLRCGSLKLEIETGRYSNPPTPAAARICKFCNFNCIEDESHFLLQCPFYHDIRISALPNFFENPSFVNNTLEIQLQRLLCNTTILSNLGQMCTPVENVL